MKKLSLIIILFAVSLSIAQDKPKRDPVYVITMEECTTAIDSLGKIINNVILQVVVSDEVMTKRLEGLLQNVGVYQQLMGQQALYTKWKQELEAKAKKPEE